MQFIQCLTESRATIRLNAEQITTKQIYRDEWHCPVCFDLVKEKNGWSPVHDIAHLMDYRFFVSRNDGILVPAWSDFSRVHKKCAEQLKQEAKEHREQRNTEMFYIAELYRVKKGKNKQIETQFFSIKWQQLQNFIIRNLNIPKVIQEIARNTGVHIALAIWRKEMRVLQPFEEMKPAPLDEDNEANLEDQQPNFGEPESGESIAKAAMEEIQNYDYLADNENYPPLNELFQMPFNPRYYIPDIDGYGETYIRNRISNTNRYQDMKKSANQFSDPEYCTGSGSEEEKWPHASLVICEPQRCLFGNNCFNLFQRFSCDTGDWGGLYDLRSKGLDTEDCLVNVFSLRKSTLQTNKAGIGLFYEGKAKRKNCWHRSGKQIVIESNDPLEAGDYIGPYDGIIRVDMDWSDQETGTPSIYTSNFLTEEMGCDSSTAKLGISSPTAFINSHHMAQNCDLFTCGLDGFPSVVVAATRRIEREEELMLNYLCRNPKAREKETEWCGCGGWDTLPKQIAYKMLMQSEEFQQFMQTAEAKEILKQIKL